MKSSLEHRIIDRYGHLQSDVARTKILEDLRSGAITVDVTGLRAGLEGLGARPFSERELAEAGLQAFGEGGMIRATTHVEPGGAAAAQMLAARSERSKTFEPIYAPELGRRWLLREIELAAEQAHADVDIDSKFHGPISVTARGSKGAIDRFELELEKIVKPHREKAAEAAAKLAPLADALVERARVALNERAAKGEDPYRREIQVLQLDPHYEAKNGDAIAKLDVFDDRQSLRWLDEPENESVLAKQIADRLPPGYRLYTAGMHTVRAYDWISYHHFDVWVLKDEEKPGEPTAKQRAAGWMSSVQLASAAKLVTRVGEDAQNAREERVIEALTELVIERLKAETERRANEGEDLFRNSVPIMRIDRDDRIDPKDKEAKAIVEKAQGDDNLMWLEHDRKGRTAELAARVSERLPPDYQLYTGNWHTSWAHERPQSHSLDFWLIPPKEKIPANELRRTDWTPRAELEARSTEVAERKHAATMKARSEILDVLAASAAEAIGDAVQSAKSKKNDRLLERIRVLTLSSQSGLKEPATAEKDVRGRQDGSSHLGWMRADHAWTDALIERLKAHVPDGYAIRWNGWSGGGGFDTSFAVSLERKP